MAFVMKERLRWSNVEARSPPFTNSGLCLSGSFVAPITRRLGEAADRSIFVITDDIKILYNEPSIVHLIVWTKFTLEDDPITGDLTPQAREQIDEFVKAMFCSKTSPENVCLQVSRHS